MIEIKKIHDPIWTHQINIDGAKDPIFFNEKISGLRLARSLARILNKVERDAAR